MNKTISVNIGGRIFNIEEAAYDKLNNYLNTIRRYFGKQESADEIISDIELRLAELFQERSSTMKQVITEADVEAVIGVMGRPEEFAGDADDIDDDGPDKAYQQRKEGTRRIFRDPDNKVVFGVCGGISAYFGWDPIVLRIAFALAFVFFGTGLLLYILLIIIIPKAKTTAEKLQMRGEPVTVENISKKVSESFTEMKEDIRDFGKKNALNEDRFRTEGERIGRFTSKAGQFIINILTLIFTLLARIIGGILLVASVLALLILFSAFLGWDFAFRLTDGSMFWDEHIQLILQSIFIDDIQRNLFVWGLAALLIIPAIGLLLMGIRLFFDYKRIPSYVGISLTGLWVIGMVLVTFSVIKVFQEFQVDARYSEPIKMPSHDIDLITIDAENLGETKYAFRTGFGGGRSFFHGIVTFPGLDSTDIMYTAKNKLTVAMNEQGDDYRLEIERQAKGASKKDAIHHASEIQTYHTFSGDSLLIFPWFAVKQGQVLRNQKVKYTLYVPVGKKVHFSKNAAEVIYDVPNTTNTYDADMAGKTWIMTRNGLACDSCLDLIQSQTDSTAAGAY